GEPRCLECGTPVRRTTAQTATDALLAAHPDTRAHVVARVPAAERELLRRDGWTRLYGDADAGLVDLDAWTRAGPLPVVTDRLTLHGGERARLAEAITAAWRLGGGMAEVWVEGAQGPLRLGEGLRCAQCGRTLRPPQPRLFSYNSPLGACETCQGFGRTTGLDLEKVIPNESLSLAQGAIVPWRTEKFSEWQDWLETWARKRAYRIPLDLPWAQLEKQHRRMVLRGFGDYTGVYGWFAYLERKRYKMHYRILLARYRGYTPCADCGGTRLRAEARSYRIGERTISDLEALPVGELKRSPPGLPAAVSPEARATAQALLRELAARLGYLEAVGLGYLTLLRQTRTLSGGEAQRIRLAEALGAQLTDTLYVLDEPSVGLHPRDTQRLLEVLRTLTDRGNTVVVVEHDADLIGAADHVIDLGPGAGAHGGDLVFAGTPAALEADRDSKTGAALRQRRLPVPARFARPTGTLTIRGARAHNLKDLTVEIPLGVFTCLSGVSGSGKSTLMIDVLYANWLRSQRGVAIAANAPSERGPCDRLEGADQIDEMVLVDQSPLARSSRSNPATYLGAWSEI